MTVATAVGVNDALPEGRLTWQSYFVFDEDEVNPRNRDVECPGTMAAAARKRHQAVLLPAGPHDETVLARRTAAILFYNLRIQELDQLCM